MKNKKHILIVDDVTTNLKCLGEILKDNYSLSMAKSGEQALVMAERVHPDLVLMDIKMPGMDGYETLDRLRELPNFDNVPVIFLTADKDSSNEIKGFKHGAKDFIHKPYEPSVMIGRIEHVLLEEEHNRQIEQLALRDPLTGVWNRLYIQNKIEKHIEANGTGTFMIMDLDNFKGINDKYGHVVGDAALVAFAKTLANFIHKDDLIARIGGDEFCVFLKDSFGKELLENRIENLIKQVEKELSVIKEDDTISSVSIGISSAPFHGKSFSELYNNADKALYYVKRNGKSGFHFYDPDEKFSFSIEQDSVIDISDLRDLISRDIQVEDGPFTVGYKSFKDIYSFLQRYSQRSGKKVQLLLFTLKNLNLNAGNDNIAESMKVLSKAIRKSLRKNDVYTEFSSSQYFVILPDVTDDNRHIVIDRITNNWNAMNLNPDVLLKYDIEEILK